LIVRKLLAADLEVLEAAEWYDSQRDHLGDELIAEVENALNRLQRDPLLHARFPRVKGHDIRSCRLHRFPYLVVYRYQADELLIIAVSHVRRKPFYWLNRLG